MEFVPTRLPEVMLFKPRAFGDARGYCDEVDFLYNCMDLYSPKHERAFRRDDPTIGLRWPLAVGMQPILSGKDAVAPSLSAAEFYA